ACRSIPAIPSIASDETVLIVASGPSAGRAPLALARGRCRIIAVNNSWQLVPWCDAIYAGDGDWWTQHDTSAFTGAKITADAKVAARLGLHHVPVDPTCDDLRFAGSAIGCGGMSGFQALNIAVRCGARRIMLVGYD